MKKIKILIITLAIVLVLGCTTFAVLYFATDVFKSDKELFYKNISKIDLSAIIDTAQFTKYQERLKNEKYENKGSISIKANMGEEMNINESFNYTSQVDNAKKLADSNVTINKEGNDVLTINYLRNEDLYGLQFKDIVSQYIVVENNNLKEFAQKLGIQDVTNIPDKIDLSEYDYSEIINEEELKQIANKYINIIIEQIPKENYSKVEGGFKLTIDLKTIQNVLIKVISELKNDEQVFHLVNSIINTVDSLNQLGFDEYQEFFQEGIEELSDEIEENFNIIEIVAYKQGKLYIKITTDLEDGSYIEASISQDNGKIVLNLTAGDEYGESLNCNIIKNIDTVENDECKIEAILKEDEEEVGNINITIKRKGSLTSNQIHDSILVSIEAPIEVDIQCENNKTFDSNIKIEEFTSSNHAVINEFDYTQISNLITNLTNIIAEKSGLSIIETLGGAGVGIISTVALESKDAGMLGGIIGTAGITIYNNYKNTKTLIDTANNNINETKANQVYEAIALARAEILSDYYTESYTIHITEQYVKELIETYLYNMSVNVTKVEGKEEYIVTVDGIELDEDKNKLDLSSIYN